MNKANQETGVVVSLREATDADLPVILEVEYTPEYRIYIGRWTADEHASAMRNPDNRYFMVADDHEKPLGYAILRGLQSEHRNIELKRIAMRSAGQGSGKQAMRLLLRKVFDEFGAHRLWLDVFETNLRAQHIYRGFGFQQEGILREAIYRDGQYHSLLLMSLLDREYRQTNPD